MRSGSKDISIKAALNASTLDPAARWDTLLHGDASWNKDEVPLLLVLLLLRLAGVNGAGDCGQQAARCSA
jgi:hypothetical protein